MKSRIKNRPEFGPDMGVRQFQAQYWYREELIQICRAHGLDYSGAKADLEERLIGFLRGPVSPPIARKKERKEKKQKRKVVTKRISLDSPVSSGFAFNAQAREFFAEYFKNPDFKFTMEMAEFVRDARAKGNERAKVQDLVKIYERVQREKKDGTRKLPPILRWNTFVRDFNRDPQTAHLKNKMEAAAKLWRIVRDRPGSKKYDRSLLKFLKE
jgi:hypothetical protein